jgi:hypothetical protein
MRKLLLCLFVILVFPAHAGAAPTTYDFGGIIPRDWRLAPPQAPYERRFISPGGEASIAFRSEHAPRLMTIRRIGLAPRGTLVVSLPERLEGMVRST